MNYEGFDTLEYGYRLVNMDQVVAMTYEPDSSANFYVTIITTSPKADCRVKVDSAEDAAAFIKKHTGLPRTKAQITSN